MAISMIEQQKCACVNKRKSDIVQSKLMGLFVFVCGKVCQQCLGDKWVGGVFIEPCQKCHRRALTLQHLPTGLRAVHKHWNTWNALSLQTHVTVKQRSKSASNSIIGVSAVFLLRIELKLLMQKDLKMGQSPDTITHAHCFVLCINTDR